MAIENRHPVRSQRMRYFLATLALVSTLHAAPRQPNVILIMADDLGYEAIAANGGEGAKTPNLDKLAQEGVRFEACHVQPLCTPTRVALMTGMVNARNYTHFGHMDPAQTTFGNIFKQAGYATGIVGKWQLGHDMTLPAKWGFDEYCLWQLTRRPSRYKNPGLEVNGKEIDYTQGEYGPDIVNEYALDFITRKKDAPFLLYYPMMLTHSPYDPTPDSADYNEKAAKNAKGKDGQRFADMVAYMDKLIGKLVARLDETGLRKDTLIVFLGDNGTGNGTPMKFRGEVVLGAKGQTIAHGTHVPLIVNWPGAAKSGHTCDNIIDVTDFLPTICAAARVSIPESLKLDGRSFLPQIRGEQGVERPWRYTWYNPSGGAKAKAEFSHDHRFKLYSDGRFFDVKADPLEQTPLKEDSLDDAARAAQRKLDVAIESFQGVRPEPIARQGQSFGGEGEAKKEKGITNKKKAPKL